MDDLPSPVDPRLTSCLQQMVQAGASDLFLVAGAPPTLKQQGQFVALGAAAIAAPDVCAMAYSVMSVAQRVAFEACMECDLAYQTDRGDRFRINVHRQRGQVGMVVRYVSPAIPSLETLGLPPVLKQLAFLKGGLVLAVGAAGAGKTTTLASLLDHRNEHTAGHILTIEDPIEYLHAHRKSLITPLMPLHTACQQCQPGGAAHPEFFP